LWRGTSWQRGWLETQTRRVELRRVDPARSVLAEEPALEPLEETPLLSQEAEELALCLGLVETLTPLDGIAKSPKIVLGRGGEACDEESWLECTGDKLRNCALGIRGETWREAWSLKSPSTDQRIEDFFFDLAIRRSYRVSGEKERCTMKELNRRSATHWHVLSIQPRVSLSSLNYTIESSFFHHLVSCTY
jgi:hypothetical protein